MSTIDIRTTLSSFTCCNCGMLFAMPELIEERRRADHAMFYCPAGHPQHFPGKTDLEKAREELAKEKQRRDQAEAQANAEREAREKAEKKLKRTQRRAAAGVCPCCTRTFKSLAQHIAAKHPEYQAANG